MTITIRAAATAAALLVAGGAQAAECIAPANPGGGWDFTCRQIGKIMTDIGVVDGPVQVTNMAGGGGGLAYQTVANERTDDEDLIVAASQATATRLAQDAYGGATADQVRFLGAIGADPGVIVVAADSRWEQDLAASKGVKLMFDVAPVALHGEGKLREVELAYLKDMEPTGETVRLRADQLFRAIGQKLETVEGLDLDGGKIAVTGAGRTSLDGVWAGGDCAGGGEDLTVTAVAEGRDAAEDIHSVLTGARPARTGALVGEPLRGIQAPPHGETPHPGTHG